MHRGVGAELWRAQQAHRAAMYESLAGVGLTPPQYAALKILEDTPGISSAEVARQAFVSAQTMQAIVASLEQRNLLVRHTQPRGRALAAWLTEDGLAALAVATRRALWVESRMTLDLDAREQQQLLELLGRCATSLEAARGEPCVSATQWKDSL